MVTVIYLYIYKNYNISKDKYNKLIIILIAIIYYIVNKISRIVQLLIFQPRHSNNRTLMEADMLIHVTIVGTHVN